MKNTSPASASSYSLESLRDQLPDYAKDTKLNLGIVLSEDGAPELTEQQIYAIALASAYATCQAGCITA